jgi:hypothetical protein
MAIYSLWQKKLVWMEFWHLNVMCFVMWTEGLNEIVVGGSQTCHIELHLGIHLPILM